MTAQSGGRGLSLASALDGSGWTTPGFGRFTPRKETGYLLYKRLGGPHGRSERGRKISPSKGFDPLTAWNRFADYERLLKNMYVIKLKIELKNLNLNMSKNPSI